MTVKKAFKLHKVVSNYIKPIYLSDGKKGKLNEYDGIHYKKLRTK